MLTWLVVLVLLGLIIAIGSAGLVVDHARGRRRTAYLLGNSHRHERASATVRFYRDVGDSSSV